MPCCWVFTKWSNINVQRSLWLSVCMYATVGGCSGGHCDSLWEIFFFLLADKIFWPPFRPVIASAEGLSLFVPLLRHNSVSFPPRFCVSVPTVLASQWVMTVRRVRSFLAVLVVAVNNQHHPAVNTLVGNGGPMIRIAIACVLMLQIRNNIL